jgi:hypothetical protein
VGHVMGSRGHMGRAPAVASGAVNSSDYRSPGCGRNRETRDPLRPAAPRPRGSASMGWPLRAGSVRPSGRQRRFGGRCVALTTGAAAGVMALGADLDERTKADAPCVIHRTPSSTAASPARWIHVRPRDGQRAMSAKVFLDTNILLYTIVSVYQCGRGRAAGCGFVIDPRGW